MAMTGEKPGRRLGYVLNALLEEALEDSTKNTAEYMETRALELLALDEPTLIELSEAGKRRQAEEEALALRDIAREHRVL